MTNSSAHSSTILQALKIRAFEAELLEQSGRGNIRGTVHTCLGQELLASTICSFVEPTDYTFGTHRGHGYYLSMTQDYRSLAREILGKADGVSNGIGGSQHLHAANLITNGVQGGLVPVAVGASLRESGGITLAVVGDGTLGQGVFYESLNVAALQNAPVLLVIEDNEISQTTPQHQNLAGSIQLRIEAFGLGYFPTDDVDEDTLRESVGQAFAFVRDQQRPATLHIRTRRLGPHSKGDDNRPQVLLEELQALDLLNQLLANSPQLENAYAEIRTETSELFSSVLAEPAAAAIPRYQHARDSIKNARGPINVISTSGRTIRQQLTESLAHTMREQQDAWLIGEDVEHLPVGMERGYSGAFGVSDDLASRFPGRVRNFPISEQAITGFAIGRALAGHPTIAEIMFGDFATLTIDQLRQQASKLVGVYDAPLPLPVLLRTPMGGRRGYGPTHSQSFEGLFLGIPNTHVFAVSPFGVGQTLMSDLLSLAIPTILLENKDLYSLEPRNSVPLPYETITPKDPLDPYILRPTARQPMATIVTYGFAAELVIQSLNRLARESEILVEVFVYESLSPMNIGPTQHSLAKTRRLAIIEEGLPEMGISSTVLANLSALPGQFPFDVTTIGARGDIGASAAAEGDALISRDRILKDITTLVRGSQ